MDKSIFQTYMEQAELKDLLQFEAYQDEVVRAQPNNEATEVFASYVLPQEIVAYLDFDHALYLRDVAIDKAQADAYEATLLEQATKAWIKQNEQLTEQLNRLR